MNEMRKLMEAVQINEESIEYRDPDGDFQVIYSFPRGYIAVGNIDSKRDISGESFDNLDDAIEHAEICLSIAADNALDDDRYSVIDDPDEVIDEGEDDDGYDESGDMKSYHRNDREYMSDILHLTDEADKEMMASGTAEEKLRRLDRIIQDISNTTRLRASGRPYTPIH